MKKLLISVNKLLIVIKMEEYQKTSIQKKLFGHLSNHLIMVGICACFLFLVMFIKKYYYVPVNIYIGLVCLFLSVYFIEMILMLFLVMDMLLVEYDNTFMYSYQNRVYIFLKSISPCILIGGIVYLCLYLDTYNK